MMDIEREIKSDVMAKAKRCVKEARAMMGSGWDHIGPELRLALVHSKVLAVVTGQCEQVSGEAVRRLANDLTLEVNRLMGE